MPSRADLPFSKKIQLSLVFSALIAGASALTACAGHLAGGTGAQLLPATTAGFDGAGFDSASQGRIQHVIIMIHENRSFDNLFATYPGADGATRGKMSNGQWVKLKEQNLAYPYDLGHSYKGYLAAYDAGRMDGFDREGSGKSGSGDAGTEPYQYVNPQQVAPYWDIAKRYVLADHLFQTQGSGSFTAHQDLIRGGTGINDTENVIDFPSAMPWGCDAPKGTTTTVLTLEQKYLYNSGPFPCFDYRTLRDLLDAKSISWKYYTPPVMGSQSAWNAFDAIRAVRYGKEWTTNIVRSNSAIMDDITHDRLPAVSWVVPDLANSDHPGNHSDTGPSWTASVVNALGKSQSWHNTAVIIVWDDWGGFYDNVAPPFRNRWGGPGFRVPMLIISPYARDGYVSHTVYGFGSILRFIEDNWGLGNLGTTDARDNSIADCFDFDQSPRKFTTIPAKYPTSYFLHQKPSYQPVDTE